MRSGERTATFVARVRDPQGGYAATFPSAFEDALLSVRVPR
ncbi:MAG TPA: hypothetical protein VGI39_39870 [Polyangiaceae bacterium]|jgi:hypothetical protein